MLKFINKLFLFVGFPFAIALGGFGLSHYSYQPGMQGDVIYDLTQAELSSDCLVREGDPNGSATLILFYHPHCPCTKTTARNLQRLLKQVPDDYRFLSFAFAPDAVADEWIESATTSMVQQMGAEVIVDRGGDRADEFGAKTSGHVLVYDPKGKLTFSGGVTASRGHEGECQATHELKRRLVRSSKEIFYWPVFGCSIELIEESVR